MKRLLSWLLVLTMIFGLLPLSAFAVEIETEGDSDFDVDFGELTGPTYIELDTVVTQGPGSSWQVTVPAGESVYYKGGFRYGQGLVATIDGETEVPLTVADDGFVYLTITNDTDAEATYTIVVDYPLGSDMNPEVITDMNWYSSEVSQAAGDNMGYFYTYTAAETGTVTLYFNAVYDENEELVENVGIRDIMVTNQNTSVQYSLLQDGVDNYGLELVVPVAAGQTLLINTSWVKDAEGNMYPAASYSWTGNFAYPAGSELNPIALEWAWDDAETTATASTTTEADGTYYTGIAGMILTVDGKEVAMDEMGVFQLNAGEHNLVLSTPVGAYNNPEVIELPIEDTNSLEADADYNYVWTATEDGTVTLDVTDGANITVNKVIEISEDGWPVTEQFELATVEYDDNWNASWVVAENLVIDVVAGQQLNIQVNGLTDWATWTTPAIDYTLTGEFESASCKHDYTGENGACINCGEFQVDETLEFYSMSMVLGADIRGIFMFRKYKATSPYESFKVVVEKNGVETELELAATSEKTSYIQYGYALTVPAKEMADVVKARIVGIMADGTYYVSNPVDWSIKIGAISLMDGYAAKTDENSQNRLKMIANMLHYGAEAQKRFEYNLDNLATDGLSEAYTSLIIKTPPTLNSMPTIDDTGVVSTLKGIAFNLDAKAEIVVMFKVPKADAKEIYSADIVQTHTAPDGTVSTKNYTIDGADCLKSSTTFGVYINNLESDEMRDILSVTLKKNGEVVSATHTFSGESALVGGLLNTYPDLANALMNYADCAYAVFGNSPLA